MMVVSIWYGLLIMFIDLFRGLHYLANTLTSNTIEYMEADKNSLFFCQYQHNII